jgi:hypothetical protein
MPEMDHATEIVILTPDHSVVDYLVPVVQFCQENGLAHYWLEAHEYETQIFSELKNPHLRQCRVCIFIGPQGDVQSWCASICGWLEEHNAQAHVLVYEIRKEEQSGPKDAPTNKSFTLRPVYSPDDLMRSLKADLER